MSFVSPAKPKYDGGLFRLYRPLAKHQTRCFEASNIDTRLLVTSRFLRSVLSAYMLLLFT